MAVDWTDERVELLKKLVTENLSAGTIARSFPGATRSAVIGKVHRLGLNLAGSIGRAKPSAPALPRPKPKPKAPPSKPRVVSGGQPGLKSIPPTNALPEGDPQPNTAAEVVKLGRGDCKWPMGDPRSPDFGFCGAAVVEGRPYCHDHNSGAANRSARPFDWKKQAAAMTFVDNLGAFRRY